MEREGGGDKEKNRAEEMKKEASINISNYLFKPPSRRVDLHRR